MRLIAAAVLLASCAVAQDTRNVVEPRIPAVCATLSAQLAAPGGKLSEGDEQKLDTARIQQALDSCAPGKAVELAADGTRNAFLSGPLELRRGVTLLVSRGAILLASRDPRLYDRAPGVCGTIDQKGRGCKPLIGGEGVSGASVMGDGIIDGRGGEKMFGGAMSWWDLAERARAGGSQNCPRIMVLNNCDSFTLYRITLRNSPNFHVSYNGGNGFTVWGVKVWSPGKGARNTDGIDPGNSTNVTITNSYIHAGDDNVAIKAGPGKPTTHMSIAHNHFYAGHGMSIGSNTDGGASAIRVYDLSIDGGDNGLRIKSNAGRGGLVQDVVYEDVCIRATKHPIYMDSDYEHFGKSGSKVPQFRNIVLRNVRITGAGKLTLDGFDERHRLGIQFDNVTLEDPRAVKIVANHAEVKLGPGAVNFRPEGEDVSVSGQVGEVSSAAPQACSGKFVPFPQAQ